MDKIGIITEIGDMGLGFEELTEKEQKVVQEAYNEEKKEQEKK